MQEMDRQRVTELLERARQAGLLDEFVVTEEQATVRAGTASVRIPLQDAYDLGRALLRNHERAKRAA